MKQCSQCKKKRPLSDYGKKKGSVLQSKCKICQRQYAKEHYQKRKQYYIDKALKNNKITYNNNRRLVDEYKSERGCQYCEENHPCCLDFHHLKDKEYSIAHKLSSLSWDSLLREIAKCVVVCSNCHRKIHASVIK